VETAKNPVAGIKITGSLLQTQVSGKRKKSVTPKVLDVSHLRRESDGMRRLGKNQAPAAKRKDDQSGPYAHGKGRREWGKLTKKEKLCKLPVKEPAQLAAM